MRLRIIGNELELDLMSSVPIMLRCKFATQSIAISAAKRVSNAIQWYPYQPVIITVDGKVFRELKQRSSGSIVKKKRRGKASAR